MQHIRILLDDVEVK